MTELQEIIAMYASGKSLKKIGAQLGRSHQYPYRKLKKAGYKLRPCRGSGPEHSQWIGGRLPVGNGYWRIWVSPDDPMAEMRTHQGYVLEHRLVMARALGRPLRRTETVHHIDDDKANNAPGNLELRQGKHGKGVVMCCLACGSHNVGFAKLAAV